MPAPSTPAVMPSPIHAPRPGTPRVAASTMLMISPASITSPKTITRAPSITLFRDYHALGGLGMELADELVTTGVQRSDPHQAFRLAGDHLLDLERGAIEFFRRGIFVADIDRHALARRNADFRRFELV